MTKSHAEISLYYALIPNDGLIEWRMGEFPANHWKYKEKGKSLKADINERIDRHMSSLKIGGKGLFETYKEVLSAKDYLIKRLPDSEEIRIPEHSMHGKLGFYGGIFVPNFSKRNPKRLREILANCPIQPKLQYYNFSPNDIKFGRVDAKEEMLKRWEENTRYNSTEGKLCFGAIIQPLNP